MKLKKIAGWSIFACFGFLIFLSELKGKMTFEGIVIAYVISLLFVVLLIKAAQWVLE